MTRRGRWWRGWRVAWGSGIPQRMENNEWYQADGCLPGATARSLPILPHTSLSTHRTPMPICHPLPFIRCSPFAVIPSDAHRSLSSTTSCLPFAVPHSL
jgi:hypothetical protein